MDRALDILDALVASNGGLSLTDLSRRVDLHKSTAHRLLQSLIGRGLASQDQETRRYRAGLRIFELANQVVDGMELRAQARPHLRQLSRRTNETVHLAVLDRGDVVYIDKEETQQTIRMYSAVGKRGPAHCTGVGKVLLAHLPEDQLDRIVAEKRLPRFTPHTITDASTLKVHLHRVREQGYAVDNTEHEPEIRCVASPIRDHRGAVIAAISLTVPAFRKSREEIERQ
ncbi:MAG: IclR family transcriptional regulator, partial [Anaerolineae bacterium]